MKSLFKLSVFGLTPKRRGVLAQNSFDPAIDWRASFLLALLDLRGRVPETVFRRDFDAARTTPRLQSPRFRLPDYGSGLGLSQGTQRGAGRFRLLRLGVRCTGADGVVLKLCGQRAEELDALDINEFAALLNPSSASPAARKSRAVPRMRVARPPP